MSLDRGAVPGSNGKPGGSSFDPLGELGEGRDDHPVAGVLFQAYSGNSGVPEYQSRV